MNRFSTNIAAALLTVFVCLPASAFTPSIRDVDITLTLLPDGTASIHERWDVCAADGTEWYLVRGNLGDIEIGNLAVSDESGRAYVDEGSWDTQRGIAEKAGRCGIVRKRDGAEICWGIGSLGDHVFDVSYTMSRSVKSLNDYDMLHLQTVSPGLSSPPRHVRVTVRAQQHQLDTANTRAWGFGFAGRVDFRDGAVVYESTEAFVRNSSVIVLLRFDKGMFDSPSRQDRDFADALAVAMEGADFGSDQDSDDGGDLARVVAIFAVAVAGMCGIAATSRRAMRKKILGMKPSEVPWSREIPFGGDLEASAYTLAKLGESSGGSGDTLAAALILRMIYRGELSVAKDSRERVEISFSAAGAGAAAGSGDGAAGGSGFAGSSGATDGAGSGSGSADSAVVGSAGSGSAGPGSAGGFAGSAGGFAGGAGGSAGGFAGGAGGSAGGFAGGAGGSADGTVVGSGSGSGSASDPAAEELREMMLKASGADKVLQHNEFSRWAKRHTHEVAGWSSRALVFGRNSLRDQKYIYGSAYTPAGQSEARKLLGLKKFLQDFTLMGEKDTIEVILWQDYMVYGALFGIADKVAEQLRDINPDLFAEVMDYDYMTMHQLLFQTRLLSAAITNSKASVAAEAAQQSARGFGGGTSFGGGGGFSGGGFGGGSR